MTIAPSRRSVRKPLHVVAFPGDVAGLGTLGSIDVSEFLNVVSTVTVGFDAYPLVDPNLMGDYTGDGYADGGSLGELTATVNGLQSLFLPPYPGKPANVPSGPDPTVSIPSTLQVGDDGSRRWCR